MNLQAISALVTIIGFFIMLFIEWPRIQERWKASSTVVIDILALSLFAFVILAPILGTIAEMLGYSVRSIIGIWSLTIAVLLALPMSIVGFVAAFTEEGKSLKDRAILFLAGVIFLLAFMVTSYFGLQDLPISL